MSDARKIGLEYKAISSNPNVPVAHSKPPDNVENFEELFILCLAVDFSSLDSTQDAVNFLNYRKVAEKSLAARILLKHAKKFTTNRKDFCLESYAFRNLGLFALAIDVCPKKDADCLVKIVDEMCAILVENSSVRAQVVGNMVLSTDVKKGFQIMIGGGESGGFWHSRRNKDAFLICDLKILVLSEMVMSERETTLLFKSPKGLEWLERAHLKKLDPSLIVENTRGLIEDKRWCAANCESYLIALIDLTDIWAAEAGSSFWLLNFFSSDASIDTSIIGIAKDKLLKLFCGETTEMLFFNLSDEDFAKISKAVFKRICEKLMKWNILVYATRAVGEFVITLDESFLAHKVFRTKRSRCLGIVRGMLEHIFLHLFQFSSCLGRTFWSSVDALRELIQEHEAMEANSFFQELLVERLTFSPNEQLLHDIPIHFLLELPLEKSEAFRPLLLRQFKKRGEKLFSGYRDNQKYPAKCLDGSEALLNRFFTVPRISHGSMSPDAIMAYLEPIGALLEGAVAEALTYDKDWKNVRPLMRAIFDALHLPTKAAEYAAICNDADIWLDIKLWTRDKLFQKKKMQLCLPDICYVSFLDNFRKEYSLLEVPLLAGNQKGTGQNPRTSLSLALLSAFGESVHHDDIVAASKKPEAYKGMTFMLKLCLLRVFMVQSEPLYMTQYVVSYLVATLDYILDSLRKDQYSLPDGIDTLHEKLKAVVDKRMYVRCDPHFFSIVQRYLRLFEGQILSTLTAFSAMRVSKEDLQRLDSSPRILQTLNKIAFSWKFQSVEFRDTGNLLVEFKAAEDENDALAGIVTFLEQRDLCANAQDLRRYVIRQDARHTKLCDLRGCNVDFTAMLGFDEDVLLALKTFSKGSEMFAVRFDVPLTDGQHHAESCSEICPSDAQQQEVAAKTRNALRELKDLVSNKDVRINDFKLSLTGVIAELQGRRRSAMAAELGRIARFFSTMAEKSLDSGKGETGTVGGPTGGASKLGTSNVLNDTLTNLNAAFNLERLKEVLVPFQAAVAELMLLPRSVMEDLQATNGYGELMGNFYVSQAPRLLGEIETILEGLSYHALLLVGKLTSADLLLIFLRKHPGLFDSGALDRAQHRAASNAHASGVLMHLSGLQTLLEPFYNHTLQSFSEMSKHLIEHLRMSQDGQECLSVAHLMNVCENWDEVEIYFRDSGDTNTDTEDIQRSVVIYQETGKFISALSGHPGGSALSLAYQQRGGKHVCLSPEQLQAHVQWAVLGGDVAVLEEFVSAFREAQRAHAIRLELEDEGHPDHQAIDPPAPLGDTCRICDVSHTVGRLSVELSEWCENTSKFCEESPRLLLLNRRNRVQLLLALRNTASRSADSLLPYAVQCFPSLFAQRESVHEALQISIFTLQDRPDLYDLALAGLLLMRVESILRLNPDCDGCLSIDTGNHETFEVTRLDLTESCAHEIYCQHLSYMINQTYGAAQPGMVLWGARTTTEREVQDLLLVAGTADLAGAVHVVGVDQLTPRIREVLLRGIEGSTLRSPLLLIFGDRDGVDSFSQYQAEVTPEKRVSGDVRPHLWSSLSSKLPPVIANPERETYFRERFAGRLTEALPPSILRLDAAVSSQQQNGTVCVVTGKSGMGKTRWINERLEKSPTSLRLNFAVHEGFAAKLVIDRLAGSFMKAHSMVVLCFDVHAEGSLESFNGFLHHLLALGLIIDDENGKSLAVPPGTRLDVLVELPEMSSEYGACEGSAAILGSNWPPVDDTLWNASQHPLLRFLPALVVAVPHDHYISIRATEPYLKCRTARRVANYLLLAKEGRLSEDYHKRVDLTSHEMRDILEEELFSKYKVSSSKRVRTFLLDLLYDRFTYFVKMLEHVDSLQHGGQEYDDYMQDPLEVRMAGSYHNILLLFIREALDISSDAAALPETSVFTIRPERVEEFEVLVATHNEKSGDFHYLKGLFMESKQLVINNGSIPPMLRANVAPAFGMVDTSGMLSTLSDCGHLLTPESLVRILHMHSRRMLGASIIYEGETGVGKSQNLKLYSLLINSNNSLFANLKLHLVAVVNAIAAIKRGAAEDAVDDEQVTREAAEALAAITPSSTLAEILIAVIAWVRVDALVRINTIGYAVCEYFDRLFLSYPLNREGFESTSAAAHKTMQRYVQIATSSPEDPGVVLARQIADAAEKAKYLMLRPDGANVTKAGVNSGADFELTVEGEDAATATAAVTRNAPLFAVDADLCDFITRIVTAPPFSLYHRILANEGLTPIQWRAFLTGVIAESVHLLQLSPAAVVCVFVDELNTAGCIGMVTEAFLSHSLDGEPLPRNIFFVGAINPLRGSSAPPGTMDFTKSNIGRIEDDDASDYLAMSPYIVRQLSPSMDNIKMHYPNLDKQGEGSFLEEHLMQHICVPKPTDTTAAVWDREMRDFIKDATVMITKAQELVREYKVPRVYMSIRNLIRCSLLLSWMINFTVPTERGTDGNTFDPQNIFLPPQQRGMIALEAIKETMRRALIMAISVTYLFQLPSHGHMLAGKAKLDLRTLFHHDITQNGSAKIQGKCVNVKEWKDVIAGSLTNLFFFANIPKGLARTTALKENFYSVVLASINKMPLLITGAPGCGKTLSFLLACDALKGNCPTHTVAFQSLKKAKKITYQCSVASTGPEIAAVCSGAHLKQRHLDEQQPGRHVCLLGLDEAGLTPENRQALKSLHDFLDMREIGTVMMSNTTLDAAKTSRTIQLLQTQANMTDLIELAWGIIAAEEAETVSKQMQKTWMLQVKGLCTAFQSLSTVILRDNWFHSRDFIFLCRLLRLLALEGGQILFDSAMLLQALRRHFQPLDPGSFPALARVFLTECGLQAPTDDALDACVVRSLRESLKDSLADGTDPTSAHCRYILVVDPTDCEASVDLLFALKLLDPTATKIVSLSDFPEDASPTMTTAALAQIKKCIEEGETLLLVNSAPLQSALYDVINRHYAVSVRDDGRTDAFANIPLGSFSSLVRVHEAFRLIVHVPISQLPKTPLPFLNRFEKYTLSVRDALAQRVLEVSLNPPHSLLCIPKAEHRQRIFRELEAGVNDFVAFAGGSTSFYGMSSTETVPALVLRALEDACLSSTSEFEPRPSVLAGMMLSERQQHQEEERDNASHSMDVDSAYLEQFNVDVDLGPAVPDNAEDTEVDARVMEETTTDPHDLTVANSSEEENNMEEAECEPTDHQPAEERADIVADRDYVSQNKRSDEINERRRARPRATHTASDSNRNDPLPTRLRALIRALNFQIMETARVESVFRLRDRLPAVYMREYLDNQQHLSVFSLLKQVLKSSLRMNETARRTTEKLVVYTRTDSHLLRLVTDSAYVQRLFSFSRGGHGSATASATASATTEDSTSGDFTTGIVSSVAEAPESSLVSMICIIPLATFSNSGDCARTLRACMCPDGGRRVLIVVADMKQIAAPQVTFARQVIDKEMMRCVSYQIERESQEEDASTGFSSLPSIVFLLHVPADQLHQRPCYQTIPLNSWSAIYVDAFCDGLLEVDIDGDRENAALHGYGYEVTHEVVEGGCTGVVSDVSIDHSPQWMRVAFSLDSAPSLLDIRREFSHLAQLAIVQAVKAISFEQRLPAQVSRALKMSSKQYLSKAGIDVSLPAYEDGDKDWVIKMLEARPYIVEALTDSFSALWGQLVQHTVQEKCERLAMGGTSRGLVESVRASHKWLISDFMHAIVRGDLAANWGLEALACLPEGALDTPHTCETESVDQMHGMRSVEDDLTAEAREQTADSTSASMAALTVHILKGIVAIRSNDHIQHEMQYTSVSSRVNCSNSPMAPRTPLYQPLMSLLDRLLPKARHRSHRIRTRESVTSEVQSDATALRALLLEDTLYADIASAVEIIEGDDEIFAAWKMDFIGVTLGYGGRDLDHTREELEALCAITTTLPGISKTAKRDLCRWLLLKNSLQSHLNAPSRLLVATRGVLLDGDIRGILDTIELGSVSSQELVGEDDDQGEEYVVRRGKDLAVYERATEARSPRDYRLVYPCLKELCVRRLWTTMFELAASGGDTILLDDGEKEKEVEGRLRRLKSWMRCVRDVLGIEAFSLRSLLGNDCENSLGWTDSRLFCVMAGVAQIIALTGVSPHFDGLTDIDHTGVSDLLHITLLLILNATSELKSAAEKIANTAQHRNLSSVVGHVMTSCLEWLFSVPIIITASQSKEQLLYGLLDNQHAYSFTALTLNARCHFLDQLLCIDKGMVQRVDAFLLTNDPGYLPSLADGTYIPSMASSAANNEGVQDILKLKNRSSDPIPGAADVMGAVIAPHELIFRIAFLSLQADPDMGSVYKISAAFTRAHHADRFDHPGPVSKIRKAALTMHLLNSIADLLSNGGVKKDPLLTLNPVTEAATAAIATSPIAWSMYLLSRLSNIGVVTDVLQSEGLLNRLGMPWTYCAKSLCKEKMILAQEYERRKKAIEELEACLNAISLSTALVTFHCQRLQLQAPSSIVSSMLGKANECITAGVGNTSMQGKAAEFVYMFATPEMSKALSMNVHIPVVLAMHAFLRDRLAFRLTDISVARTLLVAEAIDRLPLDDRLSGRKLFRDFLEAWGSLQSHFRTFDICGREVQAAREIPILTPENTYVSMLVEMEGAEVHESLPAMIVETRLLKLTSQVLRHNTLETIAADPMFNRHNFLSGSVRSESVCCLSLSAPPQLLLTGPQEGYFDRVAACYSTWIAHSDRPVMQTKIVRSDSAERMIREKMARDFQLEAHRMGMILCPRCGNRFERESGCEHVTCGNHENPYAGNAGLQPVAVGTCGMQLNAHTHRVPTPVEGQPLLACFITEADTQHIPASLLGEDAPNVTPLPSPIGEYVCDWVAVAAHLFATDIRGRVDFTIDKDFFSPLAFAMPCTEDGTKGGQNAGRMTGRGAKDSLLSKLSKRHIGDVFSRLRLVADMVAKELGVIVQDSKPASKGPTRRASASALNSDGMPPVLFSFETALTESQKNRIQQAASRQDERMLEELCDQAHTLCVGVLALIEQGYFGDLSSASLSPALFQEYQIKSICRAIPPPPGVKTWSPLLMNILDDLPLTQLCAALKCMAAVGVEGIPCSHSTLCADLPPHNRTQLNALQTKLIEEVKAETCDTALYTDELQTISSLLTGSIDSLLNESLTKYFVDFAVISKYVKEHPRTLGTVILARLQVRHYGHVVQFLRQTLGLIAYYSLLAAQLSYDLKGVKQGKGEGDGEVDGVGCAARPADCIAVAVPVTYRELVPDDWESLQNNTESNANRELSMPAPALLLEEELASLTIEEEGERWEIHMGSCTVVDRDNSSDAAPHAAKGNATTDALPPPPPITVQLDQSSYAAAWTILRNPENSKGFVSVSAALSDLGADDAESLGLLDEEHIRLLAELLKVVPSKRFLAACNVAL